MARFAVPPEGVSAVTKLLPLATTLGLLRLAAASPVRVSLPEAPVAVPLPPTRVTVTPVVTPLGTL